MKIFIPGDPIPKGRPRVTRSGHVYTPQRTREYESTIREAWQGEPIAGPVRATITAVMRIPKTKKAVGMPTRRPDLDNVVKIALDGLNGRAYVDDAQVVEIVARKLYGGEPGLEIEVEGIS